MIVHHLDVYNEKKRRLTANQFAKLMILEKGENYEYWNESESEAYELMTEREREEVRKYVEKWGEEKGEGKGKGKEKGKDEGEGRGKRKKKQQQQKLAN